MKLPLENSADVKTALGVGKKKKKNYEIFCLILFIYGMHKIDARNNIIVAKPRAHAHNSFSYFYNGWLFYEQETRQAVREYNYPFKKK